MPSEKKKKKPSSGSASKSKPSRDKKERTRLLDDDSVSDMSVDTKVSPTNMYKTNTTREAESKFRRNYALICFVILIAVVVGATMIGIGAKALADKKATDAAVAAALKMMGKGTGSATTTSPGDGP